MRSGSSLAVIVAFALCAAVQPASAGDKEAPRNLSDQTQADQLKLQSVNSAKAENDRALQIVERLRRSKKAPSAAALDELAAKLQKVREELAKLQESAAACK